MIHSASRTLALVLWIGSVPAHGAEAAQPAKPTGTICIAPFHVQTPKPDGLPSIGEPNLSLTTWGPAHDSKFTFRIDGRLRATVA
ncbi:MAG TPA: hypothetical protein VN851_12820, partial [Thermoanaerobaculia bacterium]|nr:hypothetical protein [Thermoanaerobaculia bacterium]